VAAEGDKGSAAPPPDVQDSIDAFYELIPAWSSPDSSTVFFRDIAPGSDVYRVQLSRNCFLHAPDVVAHYVVCKHNRSESLLNEMVDLTAYVLKHFDGSRLWKYLYEDSGNSIHFLHEITGSTPLELPVNERLTDAIIVECFEAHGPAVVAHFRVFDGFKEGGYSYVGTDARPTIGLHAMALVGHRTTEEGKKLYLIQSWWRSKQFFECDIDFLRSRQARLVWVAEKLTALPIALPLTNQAYQENELTGDDRWPEEGAPGNA
jgi:hypothetical protein